MADVRSVRRQDLSKPIENLPVFKGKAAESIKRYLDAPKDERAIEQRRRDDSKLLERVRPLQPKD